MKKQPVRVGVNGFGRIGRIATRIAREREGIEIVAINSRADSSSHAYLLAHDSTYGTFPHTVLAKDNAIEIDGKRIAVFKESDPAAIPWSDTGVDIVWEATGAFRSIELAQKHRVAGAKRVVVTAPPKGEMPVFCMGVNHETYNPQTHHIVSNASCTTNCVATTLKVVHEVAEILYGYMTTIHSYTDSQNLLDNSHKKDLRLARSAPNNIIPAATGASTALGMVLPSLKGKILSSAIRVPTPTVSLIDCILKVKKQVTKDAINEAFQRQSTGAMQGILTLSHDPLVSSDIRGSSYSTVVDGLLTSVHEDLVSIKAWYDNEWGYATRLVDLTLHMWEREIA